MQASRERQDMARTSFWGQLLVPLDQEDMPLWSGRALVALKTAKLEDIMARMMREQLKLTPRRANLAMRTRVLIFYKNCQSYRLE